VVGVGQRGAAGQQVAAEVMEMVKGMVAEGTELMPGIGSDIAEPGVGESAYDGTPLRPLLSLIEDGLAHLDLAAIEWLETFLATWPGTLLCASTSCLQVIASNWRCSLTKWRPLLHPTLSP